MPSSFAEFKRQGYHSQRAVSQGASLTLVAGCGEYCALFECANKCAEILGDRTLQDIGDGILDNVPSYKIPFEDLSLSLQKLSLRYSVALVDFIHTREGGRFVCLWKINPATAATPTPKPASTNLDDY